MRDLLVQDGHDALAKGRVAGAERDIEDDIGCCVLAMEGMSAIVPLPP